jgi:hypothetical protein
MKDQAKIAAMALAVALTQGAQAANNHGSAVGNATKGMFSAGTTTLPAGDYRLISAAKGLEYHLVVDAGGRMIVQDIRPASLAEALTAHPNAGSGTAVSAGATPAAVVPAAPAGAPATAAIPAVAAGTSGAPASVAGTPPTPGKPTSKIESLIRSQIRKQGPGLEKSVRKMLKF